MSTSTRTMKPYLGKPGVASSTHGRSGSLAPRLLGSAPFALGLVVLIAGVVGCGDGRPKRVAVSGRVLIDGEPVPGGSIRFVPDGERPAASELDEQGNFTLRCYDEEDGVVVGTHRVQIAAREVKPGGKVQWYAPKKYSNFRSSGLTVEVTEPTDDLVIELTWEGEKKSRGRR